MAGYVEILRTPGVARIIAAQLTARAPQGMLSLCLLLHIERMHDSYGAAGLVLAATSVGSAVAGPLTSRWMGAWGMRPVLMLTIGVCSAALLVLTLLPMPVLAQMGVAVVAGLANPPIASAVRTIYPKLVTARKLTVLFSLDATAQEIIWVAGPVLATFLATQVSTVVAMLAVVAIMLGGGAWFVANREVGRVRIPRSRRRIGAVLQRPAVLLATIVGFVLVASFAAIEASIVSVFGDGDPRSGIVIAIWSFASIAGGLLMGRLPMGPWSLARRMFFVFLGAGLALVMLDFWWLAFALVISGIGISPAIAVLSSQVSSSVRFSETAEAFGWNTTGQLIGAALGSAAAGFLIDGFGSFGGFVASAVLALLGLAIAASTVRWQPDLRGGAVGPIPDTEPVPIQPS
ncbi:MAG: MFS transporter [Micrococcales bacterium 73-13]|nr:MAG: MFS transporter [Micrococcales bacterium 73-13]